MQRPITVHAGSARRTDSRPARHSERNRTAAIRSRTGRHKTWPWLRSWVPCFSNFLFENFAVFAPFTPIPSSDGAAKVGKVAVKAIDSTADACSLRLHKPLSMTAESRQFRAELQAKYPGVEAAAYIAIASTAHLIVTTYLRRRIAKRKQGKFERAHALQASRALAEAITFLRGPEPAKPAPLTPRQQFAAQLERLTHRDDSTTAHRNRFESGAHPDAGKTTPDSAERSPEGNL